VTDSRMKDRMKGLLAGGPTLAEIPDQPLIASADTNTPRHALQVLTMAQRTADEHIAIAHRAADKIHVDAEAEAERITRDAQEHASKLRREADKVLADARESAARIAREAQARTDEAQRTAGKIVNDAQTKAEQIAEHARNNAEDLKLQAEQRYQDVVGGLATKREALQEQIEALEQFDREYRNRLMAFMQGQMRALWADAPHVDESVDETAAKS
jgi:cell division septum initiation protein DivIVA